MGDESWRCPGEEETMVVDSICDISTRREASFFQPVVYGVRRDQR